MLQSTYDVGIYLRLSRDDNNGSLESMSISNQRQILLDFVKEKGWNLKDIYADDGYSGTNFDRPDFKRLIKDIERGLINCVITKDLSRLGRNYTKVGYYTEEFFAEHGVRYIALNDSVDTMREHENDIAPFRNVLNEWYPRDISKKVRQVKRKSAEMGKFMGSQAPYGDKKSPEDKHRLLIDEPAAKTIRLIFQEIAAGKNARMIADDLTEKGIDTPRFYHAKRSGGQQPKLHEVNCWGSATISQMIRNPVYIGNMVQGKRQVISFKNKKRRTIELNQWIVVENTHEPIIDIETWQQVQTVLNQRIRVRRSNETAKIGLFSGLIICANCNSRLAYMHHNSKAGSKGYYRCSRYNNSGSAACTPHRIAEKVLSEIVLQDIRHYASLAASERESLANRLHTAMTRMQSGELAELKKAYRECNARLATIASTIKKLYEDKCTGVIPNSVFVSLMNDYLNEEEILKSKADAMESKIGAYKNDSEQVNKWLDLIDRFTNLEKLDRDTVMKLVESITISEQTGPGRKRDQQISIQYRFIGNLLQGKREDIA